MPGRRLSFRPRLLPTLLAVIGCGILSALAAWQVHRALEKSALQTRWEQLQSLPALHWGEHTAAPQAFRRVTAGGRLLAAGEVLLDNRVHRGRAGYHVITPLQVAGHSELLLVNRGWIPLGLARALPPETPVPEAEVILTGTLRVPAGRPLGLSAQAVREASGERVWPYLDRQLLSERLGVPVSEHELWLDPDQPHGFTREWPRADAKVGMHWGYALQWAAFALIALLTWGYFSLAPGPTDERHARHN